MKGFVRWFIETQLVKSKAPVWRDFFMNTIALLLILVFAYETLNRVKVTSEFMMLISMVLGFYFNSKTEHKSDKD